MITLSGVQLSSHMLWSDRYSHRSVLQTGVRTLGGNHRTFSHQIQGGRPITLQGDGESGWLTFAQVQQLIAMADIPGAIYSLNYFDEVYSVVFRHEEPPAFEASPIVYRAVPLNTDYFFAVLKLITI